MLSLYYISEVPGTIVGSPNNEALSTNNSISDLETYIETSPQRKSMANRELSASLTVYQNRPVHATNESPGRHNLFQIWEPSVHLWKAYDPIWLSSLIQILWFYVIFPIDTVSLRRCISYGPSILLRWRF